jgi:hypothetical protein
LETLRSGEPGGDGKVMVETIVSNIRIEERMEIVWLLTPEWEHTRNMLM